MSKLLRAEWLEASLLSAPHALSLRHAAAQFEQRKPWRTKTRSLLRLTAACREAAEGRLHEDPTQLIGGSAACWRLRSCHQPDHPDHGAVHARRRSSLLAGRDGEPKLCGLPREWTLRAASTHSMARCHLGSTSHTVASHDTTRRPPSNSHSRPIVSIIARPQPGPTYRKCSAKGMGVETT